MSVRTRYVECFETYSHYEIRRLLCAVQFNVAFNTEDSHDKNMKNFHFTAASINGLVSKEILFHGWSVRFNNITRKFAIF